MTEQKWGIGSADTSKPFDTVKMGKEPLNLVFGDHPHSRQDNNIYALTKKGSVYGFSGHRRPFKIEIEEYNYLKTSELSGDEIRKGGSVKIFLEGIQVFDDFCRSYESGYRLAHNFILEMEMNWGWFPKEVDTYIGKTVMYKGQLFKIDTFVISQACMMLETLDDKERKLFPGEDEQDFEPENRIKVEITSPHLNWYPKP